MKIRVFGTILILMVALSLTTIISADGVNKRIRFAKGKSSTVITGAVVRGDMDTYTVGASGGQTMTVRVTSLEKNAVFQLMDADGNYLPNAGEGDDATNWSGKLPQSGDYQIIVGGTRGNASYKLSVGIK